MIIYAASHVVGLLKTRLLISYFFGSEASLLDVYYAAFVIPDTLFQLLVIGSLSAAFIPVFTRFLAKKEEEAWHIASVSLNVIVLIFLIISTLIFIFAEPLSRLIAPGFNSSQISTMSALLRVMLGAQFFFSISGFLTGIIQSHQRFLIPALAPLAYNLGIVLGTVLLSSHIGIFGPAVGVVVGAALHMLIQLPLCYRLGFRFTPTLNLRHAGVREVIRLMPPRALALGIDQIEQFVAVILSSFLVSGSLTMLNVARLLFTLPSSLFGVTIGQAALPALSRQSAESDKSLFRHTLIDSIFQTAFFAMPMSILFIVLRIPIVRLVFGASSFPWTATLMTGKTLAVLAVSATFVAVMQLIVRGFYALQDTRTPLFIGLAAAAFDIIAGVLAVTVLDWGLVGLATAISITNIVEAAILFLILMRRIRVDIYHDLRILRSFLKLLTVGLVMGFGLWLPMRFLDRFVFDTTRTLPLIWLTGITSFIGLGVYAYLSYLFRVEELYAFVSLIKRLGRWRKLISPTTTPEPLIVAAPDQN